MGELLAAEADAEATDPAEAGAAVADADEDRVVPVWLAPAAIFLVFFVAGIVRGFDGWQPANDWAVAELIVRHLGRHVPLSGAFSLRRGYHHPLPWMYAFEWVPYRLSGERSVAVAITTVWANGALLAALTWMLARRRSLGLGLLLVAGITITVARSDLGILLLPWNPNLALVPALVLVIVTWRVACGEAHLLPLAAVLALWTAGAHLGFVPQVGALVFFCVLCLTIRTHRQGELRSLVRPATLAGAIALVLVSPMIVDLAANGTESNPVHIIDRAGQSAEGTRVPAGQGVKVLAAELSLPPAFASAATPYDGFAGTPSIRVPVLLAVGAVVAWAAWRRRATEELLGLAASSLALLAGFSALLRLDDTGLRPWYLYPSHVAAVALVAFVVWSGCRSVGAVLSEHSWRSPRPSPAVARAAIAITALALAGAAVPSLHTQHFYDHSARQVTPLVAAVEDQYPPGTKLLVQGPSPFDEFYFEALTLQLDKAGFDVRLDASEEYKYTAAMTAPPGWRGQILVLGLAGPDVPPAPGLRLVAHHQISPDFFKNRDLSLWTTAPRSTP